MHAKHQCLQGWLSSVVLLADSGFKWKHNIEQAHRASRESRSPVVPVMPLTRVANFFQLKRIIVAMACTAKTLYERGGTQSWVAVTHPHSTFVDPPRAAPRSVTGRTTSSPIRSPHKVRAAPACHRCCEFKAPGECHCCCSVDVQRQQTCRVNSA